MTSPETVTSVEPSVALPLAGRRVLVTRPEAQSSKLSSALRAVGADPIEVPAIRVEPPESWDKLDRAARQPSYDWIVFTSANGVRSFLDRLETLRVGLDWLASSRIAAIGPQTSRELQARGVKPSLVPDEYVAEALLACIEDAGPLRGARVLLPSADIAREALEKGLINQGAVVTRVVAYRTLPAEPPPWLLTRLERGQIDVVTFTSASTVRSLLAMIPGHQATLRSATIACIGPITAAAAANLGLRADVVATTYTIAGLVSALVQHYSGAPSQVSHPHQEAAP